MVTQPIPISVTVASPIAIGLTVSSPSAIAVVVTSPSTVALTVGAPSPVSVSVTTPTTIALDVNSPERIEIEVVEGMNTDDRELLYALAADAMQRKSPISLWEQGGIDFGNATDSAPGGNTNHIALTTGYQIVAQGPIPKHTWRGQGMVHIQACVSVVDTAGAGNPTPSITAAILSRSDWPDGAVDTSPITHIEVNAQARTSLAGSVKQRVFLSMFIGAEGNAASVFPYHVAGQWLYQSIVSMSRADSSPFAGQILDFDPTVDRLLELHLLCSTPSGTQTVTLEGTRAWFYNFRPGFGFEG